MRIVEEATGRCLGSVTVLLSRGELAHLRGVAEHLAVQGGGHEHVPADDNEREITFAMLEDCDSATG